MSREPAVDWLQSLFEENIINQPLKMVSNVVSAEEADQMLFFMVHLTEIRRPRS